MPVPVSRRLLTHCEEVGGGFVHEETQERTEAGARSRRHGGGVRGTRRRHGTDGIGPRGRAGVVGIGNRPGAGESALAALAPGLDYVAIGSSFAAGPGIPPVQDGAGAAACSRSALDYPSLVARDIGANLTDVSCSGATTANVLTAGQSGQPPQVRAVTSAARAVTVTIGGNDVDYLGSINAYSCRTGGGTDCGTVDREAIDRTFPALAGRIGDVVEAVRAAAPQAHVYLVTYFTLLPASGVCANVPLTEDQAAFERGIASRLARPPRPRRPRRARPWSIWPPRAAGTTRARRAPGWSRTARPRAVSPTTPTRRE